MPRDSRNEFMLTPKAMSAVEGDYWSKCIATHGNIRGVAIRATELARSMSKTHELEGMGARGMGEAAIAALLLASACKPGERVNLNIQASGFYKQALVDAYPDGRVRGYVSERALEQDDIDRQDTLGLGPWGSGLLSVLRSKNEEDVRPYIGTVPLLTGHLAKDMTFYWAQSEQINSAVGIAVSMSGKKIEAAGGFLVQALPGATIAEIKAIEGYLNEFHSLAEELARDADPVHLLSRIFQSTAFVILERTPIRFECNCSWQRVERALTLVGTAELKSMLTEDKQAMVRCDFCAKEYNIDSEALERLIQSASSSNSEGTGTNGTST